MIYISFGTVADQHYMRWRIQNERKKTHWHFSPRSITYYKSASLVDMYLESLVRYKIPHCCTTCISRFLLVKFSVVLTSSSIFDISIVFSKKILFDYLENNEAESKTLNVIPIETLRIRCC